MHASISAIILSALPLGFLIFFLSFFLFFLWVFSVYLLSLLPPPVLSYLYPFYTCSNLWDFSLLSLRLYQPLLASFQDYPLACWLPVHYFYLEGASHTTPHFQTKVFVFVSLLLITLPPLSG